MSGMVGLIEQRLQAAFAPTDLTVKDVSEDHRGHAGFQEGGESHFDVYIRAAAFQGQSRVNQH
ncbi:MAG: BolA family protein, partial [Pseudomonadota bacterium]